MRWVELIVGAIMSLMGLVWLLQGVNVLPGSSMSGQSFWAIVGLVLLVAGMALLYLGVRRRQVTSGA